MTMKTVSSWGAVALLGLAVSACAVVPKAVPAGTFVPSKAGFAVRLGEAWSQYPMGMFLDLNADVLTQDGPLLNRVYMASIPAGKSLVKTADKSVDVPVFRAGATALEQVEFVRVSFERLGFGNVTAANVRPETVDGQEGTRFDLSMTAESGLRYKADALVAEKGGQLHLVTYVAPEMHYFDKDKAAAEGILASVNLN